MRRTREIPTGTPRIRITVDEPAPGPIDEFCEFVSASRQRRQRDLARDVLLDAMAAVTRCRWSAMGPLLTPVAQ